MITLNLSTSEEDLRKAAELLDRGEVVVFPTETVYGIGARADSIEAIEKIFIAKNRPQDNPLIVHISRLEDLYLVVDNVNQTEKKLIDAFWPGPLTIIFKKRDEIPNVVSANLSTVGVRMPSNEVANKILSYASFAVAAPSANISGEPSATRSEHLKKLDGKVSAIVHSTESEIGLESTVVKVDKGEIVILRPGKISKEDIERAVDLPVRLYKKEETNLSPGLRYKHYSPKTKVVLFRAEDEDIIRSSILNRKCAFVLSKELEDFHSDNIYYLTKNNDIDEAMHNYYDILYKIDNSNYDIIYIREFEENSKSAALRDRMNRSAAGQLIDLEDL